MSLLKLAPFQTFKDYEFVDPTTKFHYKAKTMQELCRHIRLYRAQNQLEEIEFLEAVVEHWLCTRTCNRGACEKRPPFKRGVIPYLKGGVLLLRQMMYNQFAPQELADERSEICLHCPKNTFPDKEGFLAWSDKIAENSVGDRKSKNHEMLGNCDVCTCVLKSKVFFTGTFKFSVEEMSKFPDFCWQRKEALK